MKKILSILLLISSVTFGQKLNLSQISVPTGSYIIGANSVGSATNTIPFSAITGTTGLLPSTTSLTINGVTKSFTSTPTFTVNLQSATTAGNTTTLVIEAPEFSATGGRVGIYDYNDGVSLGARFSDNSYVDLFEVDGIGSIVTYKGNEILSTSRTATLTNKTYSNSILDGSVNVTGSTANRLSYFDGSKNLKSVTLGSGLSLSSGTLSATTTASTTILTASTNITISGSAPNYTISTPTQTTGLIGLTALSATSPLFYNNSTGVFTVQPSSTSQSGVLSSTDWNTFNGKQAALVSGTNIKTVNGSTLLGSGNLAVGDALVANPLSQFASTTSSQLAGVLSDETGSGVSVFGTSPTITSPTFSTSSTYSYATASTVPIFNGSKQLVSSSTTTTELTYLAGVTSSVQTQFDNKIFTIQFQSGTLSPADATTYYMSDVRIAPNTTATNFNFNLGYNYTIIGARIGVSNNTAAGTTELSTLQIRNITQSTSSSLGTFRTDGSSTLVKGTTLTGANISVASSDDIAIQIDCPTWATNPTTVLYFVTLICKR